MVNYPNGKKTLLSQKTTNQRGMILEDDINLSNEYYLSHNIAIIHKKPTPIQVVKVSYPKRTLAKITEAYFRKPSTTDYNGIYKGKYIDFEAKETHKDSFPLNNINEHQIKHLKNVKIHGGIAFVIIAFCRRNELYLVDASFIIKMYELATSSFITYQEIVEQGHLINQGYHPRLDYLSIIDSCYIKESLDEQKEKYEYFINFKESFKKDWFYTKKNQLA